MAVFTGNGSAGSPSFTFSSDTDSGFYRLAEDHFSAVTNGGRRMDIDNSGVIVNPAQFTDVDFRAVAQSGGSAWMLFADASADAVGFGVSSPQEAMHLGSGREFRIDGAGPAAYIGGFGERVILTINRKISNGVFSDVTRCASSVEAWGTASGGYIEFKTSSTPNTTPTSTASVTGDKYLRMASGTGGIQFNGDTAAGNALDDYEEGTFTPAFAFDSGTATIVYDVLRQGRYVKVGTMVTVNIRIRTDEFTVGTASGRLQITGLPFAGDAATFIGAFGSAVICLSNNTAGNVVSFKPPSGQVIYLWDAAGNANPNLASSFVQASDLVTGVNPTVNEIFATITYTTA